MPLLHSSAVPPLLIGWLINRFVSLWVRVVGGIVIYWVSRMICHYSSSGWWRGGISEKPCMQMQHRSEFFGLCFLILSWITVCIQNAKKVLYKVQSSLSLESAVHHRSLLPHPVAATNSRMSFVRRFLAFSRLTRRLALAKKHTHEECKECHEVNVMASQWNCGGGSVLWAEPGPWALPSSLSVWAAMMDTYPVLSLSGKSFSLLREEGRKGEKEEAREGKKEGEGEGEREGVWGGWKRKKGERKRRRWRVGRV